MLWVTRVNGASFVPTFGNEKVSRELLTVDANKNMCNFQVRFAIVLLVNPLQFHRRFVSIDGILMHFYLLGINKHFKQRIASEESATNI